MSILSEINRIKTAKDAIKQSIVAKGVAVDENAKLSAFPSFIENIPVAGEQKTIEDFLIYAEDLYGNEYKVQWFDYDGTMIKEQILHSLDEQIVYPDHPAHEGLLDDGWTADITTMNEVKDIMQKNTFYIAALYDVDETYAPENTTIDVVVYKHIDYPFYSNNYCFSSTLKLCLYCSSNSSNNIGGYIDWGDGTTTNITSTANANLVLAEHNFNVGKYTITIHASMPCTSYASFSNKNFVENISQINDNSCYAYIDKMNQVMDDAHKAGYHPSRGNKTGTEAVALHESGHALTDHVAGKMGTDFDSAAKRIVQDAIKNNSVKGGSAKFAASISGYAKKNYAECIAEAVADHYCNGNKASAASKMIFAELRKYA